MGKGDNSQLSGPPVHVDPNSIPARFAQCVAAPEDRAAAILTVLTATGVYLGRQSALVYNGDMIYPTLYALIVTQPSTLAAWYKWFGFLDDPPPVKNSGISKAEAVVHLVRDRVDRWDKVYTGKNEDPKWRDTMVDGGVAEKRHLITQRLGPELGSRRSAACRQLRDILNAVYHDGEMSAWVNYRDGGFHSVKEAHIALLVPEPDQQLAAAVCDQLPFLLARAEHAPVQIGLSDSILSRVVSGLMSATEIVAGEVTVASDATRAIQSQAVAKRPHAVRTLLRVAHILAILERSPVVTETLLSQAQSVVEASESTRASLRQGQCILLRDAILEFVRSTGLDGLVHHELVRHFRRHRNVSIDDIKIALDQLARERELVQRSVKTGGRDRLEWHLPPLH